PHRGDLLVFVDGCLPRQIFSRGQLKLLACAMFLARGVLVEKISGIKPIFMIDDLKSELDDAACAMVLDYLKQKGGQVIITGIDDRAFDREKNRLTEARWFGIANGVVRDEGEFNINNSSELLDAGGLLECC